VADKHPGHRFIEYEHSKWTLRKTLATIGSQNQDFDEATEEE